MNNEENGDAKIFYEEKQLNHHINDKEDIKTELKKVLKKKTSIIREIFEESLVDSLKIANARVIFDNGELSKINLPKHKKNEQNLTQVKDILYMSHEKLIEELTNENYQNGDVHKIVLYTYKWFLSEKILFGLLLNRFEIYIPLLLSPTERTLFLETIVSKIQIKILFFLRDWAKLYLEYIYNEKDVQELFFELLFRFISFKDTGSWIKAPLLQILQECEKLDEGRDFLLSDHKIKIKSLPEIFIPLHRILKYNHLLAKQLCIFDNDNLKRIKVSEFINRNWITDHKHKYSPNLTYIAEMSTKLSRLVSYFILMNKKNMIRVMLYQCLIDLCDQLIRLRNFNSAFAIYLGLQTPAVKRLNELIEPNLGKEYKQTMETLQNIFSTKNHMENLRIKQNESVTPSVPYLGQFLSDIFFLEEGTSNEEKMIAFPKYKSISVKIHKILSFKEAYSFHRVNEIIQYLKSIPYISEDQIYELSYKVLPS